MRVLVLGTTGINKKEVLEKVVDIACKEKFGLREGLAHSDAKKHIQIFDLDRRMRDKVGPGYSSIMDGKIRENQRAIWKKELQSIFDELERNQPEHVFLSIHGVYYRYNNYFSMIDMNMLGSFYPDIIITLVDDIYDVSDKITKKEEEFKTNSSCTLSEALAWRTIEILMGESISQQLYIDPESVGIDVKGINELPTNLKKLFRKNIPHFVIAVKHNPKMIFRLLFERKRLVLYSSFPITSTRVDSDKLAEINDFKNKLNDKYTIFDPSTIDELLIKEKLNMKDDEKKLIQKNKMMVEETADHILLKRLYGDYSRATELPKFLKVNHIVELKDAISKHIELRDYRLIDQSQGVVAYRPFWGASPDPSGGVDAELGHAIATGKAPLVFHPKDDGDPKLLFRGVEDAIKHSSLDDLFAQLEKWQTDKEEQMTDSPDTWE